MFARRCEPGCGKKERIVNILKISLDGQDLFFGRLIAWPPACPCVYLRIKVFLRALQHFPFGRAALSSSIFERP
jgi:hypothetical protein